ncbi:MAG: HAD-IIA family hydrolase [Terrimesophilobacter sp.]
MSDPTPLDGVDLVLADLDGVVYRGARAIPHAVESINRAGAARRVGYITNNASRTPESVAEQLSGFGLNATADDVVTSPQAAVRLLSEMVPVGSLVFAVGGEGLKVELENAGFAITESADDGPVAVIQGFSQDIGWMHLAEASYALQANGGLIPWVATNMDWTLPTARGTAPGNGALVSAIHLAVGRLPVVAGKPEVAIFEEALHRFGGSKALFLGDRLDTDILGANRAGLDSVLVLTGIDRAKQVLAADPNSRPTYVLDDLRGLHEPYPIAKDQTMPDGSRIVTVGTAVVRMAGHVVSIASRGDSKLNLLRAGAAAIWGSGLAIYGLDVESELYS